MVSSRLSDEGFELAPLAPSVGPFPSHPFLSAWWEELASGGEPLIVSDGRSLLSLHRMESLVAFMGDGDHTDYHSPLGTDPKPVLLRLVGELGSGMSLCFDSLPVEASSPIADALIAASLEPKVSEDVVSMVLDLPATSESYMEVIGKKNRHELRRKRRRYEEQIGPILHQTYVGPGFGFEEFVRLHRLAPGDKGGYMTGPRLSFYSRLAAQPGWRVDLLTRGEVATACLFGWSNDRDYYLYNSSFDPTLQSVAPGLVLLLSMIEQSINRGWRRFDFLKGNETYKSRLGATPRQLYRVDAVT